MAKKPKMSVAKRVAQWDPKTRAAAYADYTDRAASYRKEGMETEARRWEKKAKQVKPVQLARDLTSGGTSTRYKPSMSLEAQKRNAMIDKAAPDLGHLAKENAIKPIPDHLAAGMVTAIGYQGRDYKTQPLSTAEQNALDDIAKRAPVHAGAVESLKKRSMLEHARVTNEQARHDARVARQNRELAKRPDPMVQNADRVLSEEARVRKIMAEHDAKVTEARKGTVMEGVSPSTVVNPNPGNNPMSQPKGAGAGFKHTAGGGGGGRGGQKRVPKGNSTGGQWTK